MLDIVKPTSPAVYNVPDPFCCTSVDPEGAAQSRTFQYIVERSTKSRSKALGKRDAQCLRTGFGTTFSYVLERSSEYTLGVQQSSTN